MLQLGGVVAQRWTSTGREFDPQPGRGCVRRPWASCSHPSASTPADSRRRYIESLSRIPSAVMLQLERVDRTDRRAGPRTVRLIEIECRISHGLASHCPPTPDNPIRRRILAEIIVGRGRRGNRRTEYTSDGRTGGRAARLLGGSARPAAVFHQNVAASAAVPSTYCIIYRLRRRRRGGRTNGTERGRVGVMQRCRS